ncbi:MAG: carbamoyltransferase family protein [Planctomycetota bacterium]|jgi:carbamoyltransferase
MSRSKNEVVLGINAYSHDAGAALFVRGALVFAAEEERYDRVKHSPEFPRHAIEAALRHARLEPQEIDRVAFCWRRDMAVWTKLRYFLAGFPRTLPFLLERPDGLPGRVGYLQAVRTLQSDLNTADIRAPVTYVAHHRAHAAQAWRLGAHDETDIVVADGMGEWETTTAWHAHDGTLEQTAARHYPQSLGKFYAAITQHLGFLPESGEGKTMGLAPFGSDALVAPMRELVLPELRVREFGFARGRTRMAGPAFERRFGPPRAPDAPIEQRHKDIARAAQVALEEAILALLPARRSTRLALAGGIFLNCVLNGRILREAGYESVAVFPAAGDAGAAAGAAAEVAGIRRLGISHAYWGDAFDAEAIDRALAGRAHAVADDPARVAADALAKGALVGWFSGRMEFGPRALGARSILADPRLPEIQTRINRDVKFREDFRPFAPTVLREDADAWFESAADSPFMLFTFPVRAEQREKITGVVHVDGSARVQTVGSDDGHPAFRRLLERFREQTGLPLLLNTSFNVRGEPIVRTPEEALGVFDRSALDVLVLEDRVVRKS